MATETTDTPRVGEVWQRRDGSRVRIRGFGKRDGWVLTREVGGRRERFSYPPVAFSNGAFRKGGS